MNTKHTAGPWKLAGFAVETEARVKNIIGNRDPARRFVAAVACSEDVAGLPWPGADDKDNAPEDMEALANARLIASAPDLLAACEHLLGMVQCYQKHLGLPECPGYGLNPVADSIDTVQEARAAIRAATGEEV